MIDPMIGQPVMEMQTGWTRARTWGLRLVEFGMVQGLVQVFTALAGLLIVRGLSKPEYALFAIANSMQSTCNLLSDLGIGIGVRSIGGRVWNDPMRFGQLLNTTLGLRRKFALGSLSICLPIAVWMLWRNGAGLPVTIGLCMVLVASVIPLLGVTAWSASAQLHGEYRRMQKLDLGNAVMRCALIGLLALTRLNAILASLVGAIGNWMQMIFLRRWAREKIAVAAPTNADDRRELVKLSIKQIPNAIFYCFQGQLTLLILTYLGNTTGIANIMALGRIAMLFTIFSVTFSNVLAPRFARCQDPARLSRLYMLLVGGMTIILSLLAAVAWLLPGPFLWLLGAKYAALGSECGLVVAAACITQIGGIMFGLNCSKAWISIQAYACIPAILTAQVVMALLLDLHQFHNVLIFNLVSAIATLPFFALDSYRGLKSAVKK
jgi:O-antigen/teichoic acid export membrane protein